MFIAATHNGISRLYETFGNGGADTLERTLGPNDNARTWYRQNPPLPKARWSQRNNNNYQQTGLLVSLNHFAANNKILPQELLPEEQAVDSRSRRPKGRRRTSFPADDPRPGAQADLLRVLQLQGCEISARRRRFHVTVPASEARASTTSDAAGSDERHASDSRPARRSGRRPEPDRDATFPAGTYVAAHGSALQPHRRHAARLSVLGAGRPADAIPTTTPAGPSASCSTCRSCASPTSRCSTCRDRAGQGRAAARRAASPARATSSSINHNADTSLATLRYRLQGRAVRSRRRAVRGRRAEVQPRLVHHPRRQRRRPASALPPSSACRRTRSAAAPAVKTHPVRAPRIALMHTWINTQDEGWWRLALDQLTVPFNYISTQDVAARREPAREIRRHPLPAGRPRQPAADRHAACRCTATRCPGRRRT